MKEGGLPGPPLFENKYTRRETWGKFWIPKKTSKNASVGAALLTTNA
jgi:hypothetical protein